MRLPVILQFRKQIQIKSKTKPGRSKIINLIPKFAYKKPKYQRQKLDQHKISRKGLMVLKKWLLFTVIVLLILTGFVSLYWGISHFQIRQLTCQTNYQPCPEEIRAWLNNYNGKSVIKTWWELKPQLKDKFVNVTQVELTLYKLDQINLKLTLNPVVASITTMRLQIHDEFYLVTMDGLLTKITNQPILPIIVLDQLNTPIEQILPVRQTKAVKLARTLSYQGYKFTAQQTDADTLEVKLSSNISILLPLNDQRSAKDLVSALQLILSQTTIESNKDQVDLRYNQPVIRDLTVTIIPTPTATDSAELESKTSE